MKMTAVCIYSRHAYISEYLKFSHFLLYYHLHRVTGLLFKQYVTTLGKIKKYFRGKVAYGKQAYVFIGKYLVVAAQRLY